MTDWIQKRPPTEVPTPVAVAVSDFCRRAKVVASPALVREALSFLAEEEDFRVRPVTDAEPEASPLGPFAVVDLIFGAAPELAARRQACGYYELVQQLAARGPAAAAAVAAPAQPPARLMASKANKKAKEEQSMAERIAPKKRAAEALAAPAAAEPSDEPAYQKRPLPAPRGRYTRVASARHPAIELLEPAAAEELAKLIDQHGNRAALTQALSDQYAGAGGSPFSTADLEAALERHQLTAKLVSRERELILSAYKEHRGASGRVAWALGMSPAELERLVAGGGLSRDVDELRERFKREALSPDLRYRLDLLGRTRYLSDLGIKDRFTERLTGDLRALLEGCLEGSADLPSLVQAAARKHGLAPELVSRAVDKLGLAGPLSQRLPRKAADS